MKKNLTILCLLFLPAFRATGQVAMNKDSLLRLLPSMRKDTSAVLTYINLGQQYETSMPDSAKYYYRKAGDLSKELGWDIGVIKYISNYTFVLNVQGKFDSSLLLNRQSLEIARRINNPEKLAVSLNNIGAVYQNTRQFDSALYYFLECTKVYQTRDHMDFQIVAENNLSALYNSLEQYSAALEHSRKAIALARDYDNDRILVDALVNMGSTRLGLHQPDTAILFLQEAIGLSRKLESTYQLEQALLNLGTAQLEVGDYDGILKSATESLRLSQEIGNQDGVNSSYNQLGVYYLYKGDHAKAREMAEKGLQGAKELNDAETMSVSLSLLSNIAIASGDFRGYRKYRELADSVNNAYLSDKMLSRIDDMKVKYETEKKEAALKLKQAELDRKSVWNYILIGSAVAMLLVILLSFRTYRIRQELQQQRIRELEQAQKLLSAEAVLKGEEQERSRLAKDLHDGLGGMLSGIKYSLQNMKGNQVMTPENQQAFERSLDMLDSSIREMRRVAHNLMPEALVKFGLVTALRDYCDDIRKGGALAVSFQPIGMEDTVIDTNLSLTIYRIVQELVNNSMKHAGASSVIVQLSRSAAGLDVTVEDDGRGFDPAALEHARGIGWMNIRSRVEYLKGKLDVQSGTGKGASVHIEIPF